MKLQQKIIFQIPIIVFITICISACTASTRLGNPQSPYPPTSTPEVGQIVHMPTGILISEIQMLEIVSDNRIAYVGETHDNPASHRLQLTILKALAERYPNRVALGMEMFTPAQDETLGKWVSGESSEKQFLKEAGWYKVWKSGFDYYRDILNFAREYKIPVIGLNAEKKIVRLIVANELSSLSPEDQAVIPEMDLTDPYQRGLVEGIYGGHVKSEGMLKGFHRAQTLWDETMAESIVKFLQKDEHKDFRMVVIAGGNHVRYGFGIPRRVFRRMPLSYSLIGGKEIEIPESKKDKLMDVTLPEFPMTPYDFMVFTRYEELEKTGVKLGVMLDDEDGSIVIKGVVPESNAERAGLLKGDVILSIDDEEVSDTFDVVYVVKNKESGERIMLDISRKNTRIKIEVVLINSNSNGNNRSRKIP